MGIELPNWQSVSLTLSNFAVWQKRTCTLKSSKYFKMQVQDYIKICVNFNGSLQRVVKIEISVKQCKCQSSQKIKISRKLASINVECVIYLLLNLNLLRTNNHNAITFVETSIYYCLRIIEKFHACEITMRLT